MSIPEPESDDARPDPSPMSEPAGDAPSQRSAVPKPSEIFKSKPRPPHSDQGIDEAEQQTDAQL